MVTLNTRLNIIKKLVLVNVLKINSRKYVKITNET